MSRGNSMPLIEHIREFRNRFLKSTLAISIGAVFGWIFYQRIITELTKPFCNLDAIAKSGHNYCGDLYINGLIGPFNLHVKVALISGAILSAPIWLYQIWSFITPALHKKEKRMALFFLFIASPLFGAGSICAYLLLPHAVHVLLGFTPSDLGNLIRFDDYLDFVLRLILLFGIAFVIPVFLLLLNLIGLLSGKSILKPWRFAIFVIFLFTAAFTPTPDPITMTLLAIPICILYFVSGFIALIIDRKRVDRANLPDDEVTQIDKPEKL